MYTVGLDVGSTTAKMVVLSDEKRIVFSKYVRHHAQIDQTVATLCEEVLRVTGDEKVRIAVTGSAAMGLAERLQLPFIQELVASAEFVSEGHGEVKTLIDMGGEDTKMIFFEANKLPDIRMNGNCAGGTGAFIDQMASLLNVTPEEFGRLASQHTQIFPIASRCGVFAKTDVQNLLSRKVKHEDVAASVFYAVAMQCMNTLARGYDVVSKVMFTGGPFSFLPELSKTFLEVLHMTEADRVHIDHPELVPAWGAALYASNRQDTIQLSAWLQRLQTKTENKVLGNRLNPLFASEADHQEWIRKRSSLHFKTVSLKDYKASNVFLGIDSGSTTTKIVIMGTQQELLFHYYAPNKGQPIEAIQTGLSQFRAEMQAAGKDLTICYGVTTGYGEDLIRTAFNLNEGIVETMAHYIASYYFNPAVSFILDIGGQDMKAFFVRDGQVQRVELNESCSSGCGSFLETFSASLGYPVTLFAQMACLAQAPCDLGSRCTVFMNSRVKQALRENATIEDIAAGLSYAVIRNALYKVLSIRDLKELGHCVMVQGGTFKNDSVRRAFEVLTQCDTLMTDFPEMMGAFGAAWFGQQQYNLRSDAAKALIPAFAWDAIAEASAYTTTLRSCKGCENHCEVSEMRFQRGRAFYSGNKCENIFHNYKKSERKGENLMAYKASLLFPASQEKTLRGEPLKEESIVSSKVSIGIPRGLHFFENAIFWRTLLEQSGLQVVFSSPSVTPIYRKGMGSIMSDNICFPAKLLHGHVMDLVEKKVDRILYPMAFYERQEHPDVVNSYNCPIVSAYSDVLKSSLRTESRYGIPLDAPVMNFAEPDLLRKACVKYLKGLGVKEAVSQKAFVNAWNTQIDYKKQLKIHAASTISRTRESKELLIVLAGRPYHIDSLINSKVPEILSGFGAHVITEDMIPFDPSLQDVHVLTQWGYVNRIYAAAKWVASQPDNVQMVQINSFGCGPDAIAIDEVREILHEGGKYLTVVRVDEINATGSLRLRLRTMIGSIAYHRQMWPQNSMPSFTRPVNVLFESKDKTIRTIIGPDFGPFYSTFIRPIFELSGYHYVQLPEPNNLSMQTGLKYANNEICYPATIVVGDIIKEVLSGKYDRHTLAIAITQTCGQCRASSYISLIKKALIAAGYPDIPVVSMGTEGKTVNTQPGFKLDFLGMIREIISTLLSADMLMKMCYAIEARETHKGDAAQVADRYLKQIESLFMQRKPAQMFTVMEQAVQDFNQIPIHSRPVMRVGLVGEIYVKYNAFGNGHIMEWLHQHDVEVVVPPLIDFFIQTFVNRKVNRAAFLQKSSLMESVFAGAFSGYIRQQIRKANQILSRFRFENKFHDIEDMAKMAEPVVSLVNQFGEGWLIPAEIALFAKMGIERVVSVQPFGCIANQVVSKGIEKKIKEQFPAMNLLFLDYDSNVSEVNVQNRLHFILQ